VNGLGHRSTLDDPSNADDQTSLRSLTLDLLSWIGSRPRSYAETMDAWRSSCPRLTIWEDALADDLVRVETGSGTRLSEARVVLTPRGQSVILGTRRNEPASSSDGEELWT
jgi:hypothetical protein